jgi:hypothetical protein
MLAEVEDKLLIWVSNVSVIVRVIVGAIAITIWVW